MGDFLKKGLIFLSILILASVLFNNPTKNEVTSSASEIVEIIDQNPEIKEEIEQNTVKEPEKNNIFVIIIKTISNLFKSIINSLFKVVSSIVSSFAG